MRSHFSILTGALALGLAACANQTIAADKVESSVSSYDSATDLKPFPAATAGQTQHVIRLPAVENEDHLKVELIVGRTMQIDCNAHFFGGRIAERTAEGWGYTYYVLDDLGPAASTMKGCPPGSEHEAFVRSSDQLLVRYNSRLPVVVYTPADVELRYRVWQAGPEQSVR